MLIKHPRADMAANAAKSASEQALAEADGRAAALVGTPMLERRRLIMVSVGAGISLLWILFCVSYINSSIGWTNLWHALPHEIGAFIAGVAAPLAFLWLMLLNMWRGMAIKRQSAALHELLLDLSYPTPEAERRVSALAGALRRQAREMEEAAQSATAQIATLGETMSGQQQELLAAATGAREQVAQQARQITGTLQQSSQSLLSAAEQVNRDLDNTVKGLAGRFEEQSRSLVDAAEKVGTEMNSKVSCLGQTVSSQAVFRFCFPARYH